MEERAYGAVHDWGMARWVRPLLNIMFDGISDTVDYQLKEVLGSWDMGGGYYRFQVELSAAEEAMDDASSGNIEALKKHAEDLIAKDGKEALDHLCKQLVPHRVLPAIVPGGERSRAA